MGNPKNRLPAVPRVQFPPDVILARLAMSRHAIIHPHKHNHPNVGKPCKDTICIYIVVCLRIIYIHIKSYDASKIWLCPVFNKHVIWIVTECLCTQWSSDQKLNASHGTITIQQRPITKPISLLNLYLITLFQDRAHQLFPAFSPGLQQSGWWTEKSQVL